MDIYTNIYTYVPNNEGFICADLRNMNFRCADLTSARFHDSDLRGVDFRDSKLGGAIFRNTKLNGADFEYANLGFTDFERADLSDVNLEHTNLKNAYFGDANLTNTCLDPDNLPNMKATGFERFSSRSGMIWCIGYRTLNSHYMNHSYRYEVGKLYEAPLFSTAEDTECHPGLYVQPELGCFHCNAILIKVIFPDYVLHRARTKYRVKWFIVVEEVV